MEITKNLFESITSSHFWRIKGLLTVVVFESHICTVLTFKLEITTRQCCGLIFIKCGTNGFYFISQFFCFIYVMEMLMLKIVWVAFDGSSVVSGRSVVVTPVDFVHCWWYFNRYLFSWRHLLISSLRLLSNFVFILNLHIAYFSDRQRLQLWFILLNPDVLLMIFH